MKETTANPLLQAWAAGRQTFGAWATIPSPISAEFMAREGPDYVCVDNQHGLLDHSDTVPMLAAIEAGGSVPIVRVAWNDPPRIMAALDAGAFGVIVPMVNDAVEARRAATACRFPPRGTRSYGPVRAKYVLGTTDPDVLNDIVCIAMVETADGLKHLDEIVTTDGIDAVYIGPSDLALAVGQKPGPRPYDDLAEPLGLIMAACRRHGIAVGIHALNGEAAARYAEDGYDMITVFSDGSLLAGAVAANLRTARGGGTGHTPTSAQTRVGSQAK
jgi:4-hydroxy-2-oxoheptanedioate aldolase